MVRDLFEEKTDDSLSRRFVAMCERDATPQQVINGLQDREGFPRFRDKHESRHGYAVTCISASPDYKSGDELTGYSRWTINVEYGCLEKRKVCVILVDRANWGRMERVVRAIADHPDLELQIICAGSMLLPRFGCPVDIVRKEYEVSGEVWCEIEGSTLGTMADSIGYAIPMFGAQFERLQPDIVLGIGDRYEMLSAVIAAAYRNTTVVHLQGGEVSGSIDESARHCLTKLAHYHVPATEEAAKNILRMGETPESILAIGCPSADLAAEVDYDDEPDGPILCVYHPTTTEYGHERDEMMQVLAAISGVPHACTLLWPNIDAGGDAINKAIRIWRDQYKAKGLSLDWLTTIKNLPPAEYLKRLANTRCAVGNSSSFIRDDSFFGTPVVMIGNRQQGRECGPNVLRVPCEKTAIRDAIEKQLEHGRYPASDLYGEPGISEVIADKLATLELYCQKRLYYPVERYKHEN